MRRDERGIQRYADVCPGGAAEVRCRSPDDRSCPDQNNAEPVEHVGSREQIGPGLSQPGTAARDPSRTLGRRRLRSIGCPFSLVAPSQGARLEAPMRHSSGGSMRRRKFITLLGGCGGSLADRGTRAATGEDEADRFRSPFGQSQRNKRER